ncbi:MAG TPA: alpha/beta hydrolase [Rhabdochlamydiaceae bacterium]|nr:alpha/beta hydrolase [Rhabdochlamydiaceae bacterium]
MPFLRANDLDIYYEIHGEGTPLVMICGFRTNLLSWKDYVKPLSKHYKLVLFDNRGVGQTEAPEIPYSIEMMAEDTSALMEALNIPDAHFYGHSMGASIVMRMCIEHPDKVRKAMLGAAAAKLPDTTKLVIEASSKLFEHAPKELVFESLFPWFYSNTFLSDPENVKQAVHERLHNPYPQSPAGYYGQKDAVIQYDLREDLKKIQAKTLIVAGEEDLCTPSFCHQFLMKHIPDAKLAMIKQQAHAFHLERPQEVMELMRKFFH